MKHENDIRYLLGEIADAYWSLMEIIEATCGLMAESDRQRELSSDPLKLEFQKFRLGFTGTMLSMPLLDVLRQAPAWCAESEEARSEAADRWCYQLVGCLMKQLVLWDDKPRRDLLPAFLAGLKLKVPKPPQSPGNSTMKKVR